MPRLLPLHSSNWRTSKVGYYIDRHLLKRQRPLSGLLFDTPSQKACCVGNVRLKFLMFASGGYGIGYSSFVFGSGAKAPAPKNNGFKGLSAFITAQHQPSGLVLFRSSLRSSCSRPPSVPLSRASRVAPPLFLRALGRWGVATSDF